MSPTDLRRVAEPGAEIARLYLELQRLGARAEGAREPWRFGEPSAEEVLVIAAQAARREPRLAWVVVELVARRWDAFDPLKLRRALLRARWPAALGPLLEFARRAARSAELDDVAAFVMKPVRPAPGERFFLGTRAFGGELSRRDAEESLAEYRRWGYFSREEPIAKELGAAAHGSMRRAERMNLLRRLAARGEELTLGDYVQALRGLVSRRQAMRDLAAAPFLAKAGAGRGARYALRPPAPRRRS